MTTRKLNWLLFFLAGLAGLVPVPVHAEPERVVLSVLMHIRGADTLSGIGSWLSAVGDVNRDGFADIGLTSGSPPRTLIYFGAGDTTADLILPYYGKILANTDYDGDGISDLALRPLDGHWVYIFKGYPDSVGALPFDSFAVRDAGCLLQFAAEDVNKTGLGDYLVSSWCDSDTSRVFLFVDPFTNKTPEWQYKEPQTRHRLEGVDFIDYNQDGWQDIVLALPAQSDTTSSVKIFFGPNYGSLPSVTLRTPPGFPFDQPQFFGEKSVNVGDVNADGWDDLYVEYFTDGLIYGSSPLADTVFDVHLEIETRNAVEVHDLNGDQYHDFVAKTPRAFVVGTVDMFLGWPRFSGVSSGYVTQGDLVPIYIDRFTGEMVGLGDVNGDGRDDFAVTTEHTFGNGGNPGDVWVMGGTTDLKVDVQDDSVGQLLNQAVTVDVFPNPGNPRVSFAISINRLQTLNIEIRNLLAQSVADIHQGQLGLGRHEFAWEGVDAKGQEVASGVYFLRVITESETIIRKIMLVR